MSFANYNGIKCSFIHPRAARQCHQNVDRHCMAAGITSCKKHFEHHLHNLPEFAQQKAMTDYVKSNEQHENYCQQEHIRASTRAYDAAALLINKPVTLHLQQQRLTSILDQIEHLSKDELLQLLTQVNRKVTSMLPTNEVLELNKWFIADKQNRTVFYKFVGQYGNQTCMLLVSYKKDGVVQTLSAVTKASTQKEAKVAAAAKVLEQISAL